MRLANERPDWIPVLHAVVKQATKSELYGGEFPGHAVLLELQAETGTRIWLPGLRLLVAYGLLQKSGESTRGGRRAYYHLPDREGVEEALKTLERLGVRNLIGRGTAG
jgi:hypothetical protein